MKFVEQSSWNNPKHALRRFYSNAMVERHGFRHENGLAATLSGQVKMSSRVEGPLK